MKAYLIQIDGWDGATAMPVRLASHDDDRLCHLNGQTWWPAIATLPTLRYDFFDGAFDAGSITSPTGSFTAAIGAIPNLPALALHDARIRIWRGELGDAWGGFTLLFDGRVKEQPAISDGIASFSIGTDDSWLDQPLLSTYAGTGGAEGSTDLQGQVKPLALGAPRFAPAVLVDAVDNIYQLSAYGAINAVEVAFERLIRFGAAAGSAASFNALRDAALEPGQWGVAPSGGYVRFGAPPAGLVSFHTQGDAVGGWSRRAGAIIARIAAIAGGTAKVAAADITALNAARPWNLSLMVTAQTTARDLIQRIAASVNAVAYVDWLGMLRVAAIGIGTASMTMAADGSALPPVASVEQVAIGAPYWKIAQGAAVTWQVHSLSDIAFTAPLNPRGPYDPAETYREGDMVTLPNGSQWLYIATNPGTGSAPGDGNTSWFRLSDDITADNITYVDGTPMEELKPAEPNATNGATEEQAMDIEAAKQDIQNLITTYGSTASAAASASAAELSASAAQSAKAAAETAKANAEQAKTDAQTAFNGSTTARDAAIAAKTASETARDQAQTSASNAAGSATASAGSASNAATKSTEADQSASAAAASAITASFLDVGYVADFSNSAANGFVASEGTLTPGTSGTTFAQTGGDAQFIRTGLTIEGSRFTRVIVDLTRTVARNSGSSQGALFWATAGHSWNAAYVAYAANDPQLNKRTQLIFDLPAATGASDWLGSVITGLRIDLDQGMTAGSFVIHSVRVVGTDGLAPSKMATAAANSASAAAISATNAGTSATAAQNSATSANTSAGNASTSAGQASTSATNAAGSASAASTSATNAANSATAAGNSASAASTSASTASTKATEAGQSASAAAGSATTASTKAGEASTSATQASNSATTAQGHASNASTSATAAATSATNAGNSATAASTSANTAGTKATEAGDSASAAATSAVTAGFLDVGYVADFSTGSLNGWAAVSASLTAGTGGATLAVTAADPQLIRNGLSILGSRFTRVVVDVTRTANRVSSFFDGVLFWSTSGHSWSVSYRTKLPASAEPVLNERTALIFDVPNDVGGADWTASTITGLRLDLDQGTGGSFVIHSIRVVGPDGLAPSNAASAAAISASNAATSATNAGNSATAAQTSATTANTKAGDASNSATAAAGSASSAATSSTNAGSSATAAQNSATAAATSASNANTSATSAAGSATTATDKAAAAASSADLAAIYTGTASFLDVAQAWDFQTGSVNDFAANDATLTGGTGGALLAYSGIDPWIAKPGLSIQGSRFTRVVVELTRTANRSGGFWDGALYWATTGHSWSGSYRALATVDPALNRRTTLVYDMTTATGASDWTASTITGLRLDLDGGATGSFIIHSIRVVGGDGLAPAASASVAANSAAVASASAAAASSSATTAATYGGGGGNLLVNSSLPNLDTTGWNNGSQNGATFSVNGAGDGFRPVGENVLTIHQNNTTNTGYSEWGSLFGAEPGKYYEASVYYAHHRCTGTLYIQWFDGSGALPGAPSAAMATISGGDKLSGYGRAHVKGLAPAGTVRGRIILRKFGTTSGSDSWAFYARPQAKEVNEASVGPTPYSPSDNRAAVEVISAAAAEASARTRAFLQVNAAVPGQRAQLTVWADNAGAGVDIVGNVAISGNLLVDGTVNGQKIGGGAVDTGKIAPEAVTKSYFAMLASPITTMPVNAETNILDVTLTGVQAGEVLRVSGLLRITCPDDLLGDVGVTYAVNGGAPALIGAWYDYKFDSDGGASTNMAMPVLVSLAAPSSGTYVIRLRYYNRKSGSDAGSGSSLDVMRQRR